MQELYLYAKVLKEIIDRHYEKETVFYDMGEWYSRYHSRNLTLDELVKWVLEISDKEEYYD